MFFCFVTLHYKPFTVTQGRWEMGTTKAIWEGKVNPYLVPFPIFSLSHPRERDSAMGFNQQFKVRVGAPYSLKHSFQLN